MNAKLTLPTLHQVKMVAKLKREFNPKIKSQSASLNILAKEMGQEDWNSLRPQLIDDKKLTNGSNALYLEQKTRKLLSDVMYKWDLIIENPYKTYDYPIGNIVFRPKSDPLMGIVSMIVCQRDEGFEDRFIIKIFFADGIDDLNYLMSKIETQIYLQLFSNKDWKAIDDFKNYLFKCILIEAFFHRYQAKKLEVIQRQKHEEAQIGDVYLAWTTGDFFEIVKKTKKFIVLQQITTTTIKEEDVPLEKRRKGPLIGDNDKRYLKPNYGDIDMRKKSFRKKIYVFVGEDYISPYVLRDKGGEVIENVKDRDIIWHRNLIREILVV